MRHERRKLIKYNSTWGAKHQIDVDIGTLARRVEQMKFFHVRIAHHAADRPVPCSRSLRLKAVHPEEVRRRDERFPHPAEPGFAAQRMPSGSRFGKIVGTDMGPHRLIFLGR